MQADDDQHRLTRRGLTLPGMATPKQSTSASYPLHGLEYRLLHALLPRPGERETREPTLYSEALDLDTVPSQGIANLARRQSKQARRLGLYPPGPFHRRDYALAICDLGGTYARSAGWL